MGGLHAELANVEVCTFKLALSRWFVLDNMPRYLK